jgi:hypothetical protein
MLDPLMGADFDRERPMRMDHDYGWQPREQRSEPGDNAVFGYVFAFVLAAVMVIIIRAYLGV